MRGPAIYAAAAMVVSTWVNAQEIDWKKVDDALGRSAAVTGDVHRYGFARSDLNVTLDGVTIKPALALGGWTAFKPVHDGAMMMGDLVLLETEINAVMTAAMRTDSNHSHSQSHPACATADVLHARQRHGDPVKLQTPCTQPLPRAKLLWSFLPLLPPPPTLVSTPQS